ncbi:hypothetical protein FRC02_010621, partial [Tulasnella sp. 418]
ESGLQGHRQSLRHFTPARSQVMFTESRVVQVSQPQYQPPDMSTFWEFINQTRYTSCPQCSQQILRVELVRHMAENHPIFRCSDCNEIFDNRSELDSHHSSGSSLQEIMKTVCPCGDSFASRLEAIRHIHENREDEDHFTFCFHCELSFESIADYVVSQCPLRGIQCGLFRADISCILSVTMKGCTTTYILQIFCARIQRLHTAVAPSSNRLNKAPKKARLL